MKSTREQFEEIWPVPDCIEWAPMSCCYIPAYGRRINSESVNLSLEYNARLETFTRCQETTEVYVSLVDELIKELEWSYAGLEACEIDHGSEVLSRAKQIMGDR